MNATELIETIEALTDARAGKVLKYVFRKMSNGNKFTMSIFEEAIEMTSSRKRIASSVEPMDEYGDEFERFRIMYPGTKRGFATEYGNLKNKHKDYKEVIPKLVPALRNEIAWHTHLRKIGAFCPEYKNMQTWINQRCWEQEFNKEQLNSGTNRKSDQNADNALSAIRSLVQ